MRRGLIADLKPQGSIAREAARELTNMRRILAAIEGVAGRMPPGEPRTVTILGMCEQGLKLTNPE